jgi:hypothetical protein
MPQRSLQMLKLLEENAAAQVEQLEEILEAVEPAHPARRLIERALRDARDRQRAGDAAWRAALEALAGIRRERGEE